jgi:acetoacetyl-CoA reductase
MLVDDEIYENWQRSVDSAFGPFAKLAELTGMAMDRLSRQPLEVFNLAFENGARHQKAMLSRLGYTTPGTQQAARVALVTGGIGGIGTAICRRLARDGNQVVATYLASQLEDAREWQAIQRDEGLRIELVECDVTNFDDCRRMTEEIEAELGPVGILVNCAGIVSDATLRKMEEAQWHAVLDTNLDGVFNVTRQVVGQMIKRGTGRIINISSVNGQKGQFGQANYSAAKAGILGFSKALARELAYKKITVNSVCPGYVATQMMKAIPKHVLDGIVDQIPMNRLADPDEIAAAVAFLASDEGSYITGAELAVNGGLFMG